MSDGIDIDNLFIELVKNISVKIEEQQKELLSLKDELLLFKNNTIDKLSNENNKTELEDFKNKLLIDVKKIVEHELSKYNEHKISNNSVTELQYDNLLNLPAYTKTDMFKEIKRPKNINELYMMVIQSQRTINELQTAVDNMSRRN